jgi:hypothetical protein
MVAKENSDLCSHVMSGLALSAFLSSKTLPHESNPKYKKGSAQARRQEHGSKDGQICQFWQVSTDAHEVAVLDSELR